MRLVQSVYQIRKEKVKQQIKKDHINYKVNKHPEIDR